MSLFAILVFVDSVRSHSTGSWGDLCRNHCICGVRKTLPCLLLPCQWHHTPFLLTVSLGLLGSNDLLFSHPYRLITWPCVWTNAGIEELFHSPGTILTSIVTSWVGSPQSPHSAENCEYRYCLLVNCTTCVVKGLSHGYRVRAWWCCDSALPESKSFIVANFESVTVLKQWSNFFPA